MKTLLYLILLLFFLHLELVKGQDTYRLCDYISNNTQCVEPANNCQEIVENTCHPQADCDATGLCFSKLTTNHATEVHVKNYRNSCNEDPAFTLNLTLDICQVVEVFGQTFPTQVTRIDGTSSASHLSILVILLLPLCFIL